MSLDIKWKTHYQKRIQSGLKCAKNRRTQRGGRGQLRWFGNEGYLEDCLAFELPKQNQTPVLESM